MVAVGGRAVAVGAGGTVVAVAAGGIAVGGGLVGARVGEGGAERVAGTVAVAGSGVAGELVSQALRPSAMIKRLKTVKKGRSKVASFV
jgi:hypothetical protein